MPKTNPELLRARRLISHAQSRLLIEFGIFGSDPAMKQLTEAARIIYRNRSQ